MQMSGERTIAAERAKVWEALNDPEVLKACIPGCQEMTKTSPTEFEAKVTQKVGPVKATFNGAVELTDIVEGHSYRISGKGKGGATGGASGGAAVRLEEVPEGTKLAYDVDAKVTGKLAQLGSRLIDGFAKKFADDFFDRFKARVEGPGAVVSGDGGGAAAGTTGGTTGETTGGSAGAGVSAGTDVATGSGARTTAEAAAEHGESPAIADRAVAADAADAPAPPPEQGHEIPRPGDAGGQGTTTPPVVGRSAARAQESAASTTEAKLASERADPAPQKKSWWARLFG